MLHCQCHYVLVRPQSVESRQLVSYSYAEKWRINEQETGQSSTHFHRGFLVRCIYRPEMNGVTHIWIIPLYPRVAEDLAAISQTPDQ